jgi:hypothetical protein
MTEPGDQTAADADAGDGPGVSGTSRALVIRTLGAALAQGRLTEEEHDERVARAAASRSRAELAALTADLPAGLLARLPMAIDVRTGVCVTIAAAGVVAGILLWQPDNVLAFTMFLLAAVALCLAPVLTLGLMIDVRHQKRSGGQLPPGPNPGAGR